jgi:hypothetical protein
VRLAAMSVGDRLDDREPKATAAVTTTRIVSAEALEGAR